jgi:sn1-specific diacylglycerol lipase
LKELLGESGTHSGYRLRVTGHSLGAGAAVILTLLLRCEYRNARCLAFSPPGCTTSANLADECSEWTTSYILDTDIIPRVSVESFEALRDETLEMIARIKIPKYKVVRYRDQKDGKGIALDEFLAYSLHHKGDIEESKFLEQLREFREFQKSLKAKHQLHYVSLFPPGKIIQLFGSDNFAEKMMRSDETMASSDVVIENPYTARWAEKTDFREVILSSHFLSDHKTANVKAELHAMAKRFGLEQPFSSVLSWGDDLNV